MMSCDGAMTAYMDNYRFLPSLRLSPFLLFPSSVSTLCLKHGRHSPSLSTTFLHLDLSCTRLCPMADSFLFTRAPRLVRARLTLGKSALALHDRQVFCGSEEAYGALGYEYSR